MDGIVIVIEGMMSVREGSHGCAGAFKLSGLGWVCVAGDQMERPMIHCTCDPAKEDMLNHMVYAWRQ